MLLKLIGLVEQSINDEEKILTREDYVEKKEIDRSALYSFDGPFQLIHANVGNLEFLGKSATTPRYVLLAVDFYPSKVYVYPMCSREQILHKMKQFYEDIKNQRNKLTSSVRELCEGWKRHTKKKNENLKVE